MQVANHQAQRSSYKDLKIKFYVEEKLWIKYYKKKHSKLLIIQIRWLWAWLPLIDDKCFDKTSINISTQKRTGKISGNQQYANELYRPITWKFQEHKVYSSFRDNIWGDWSCKYAIDKQIQ